MLYLYKLHSIHVFVNLTLLLVISLLPNIQMRMTILVLRSHVVWCLTSWCLHAMEMHVPLKRLGQFIFVPLPKQGHCEDARYCLLGLVSETDCTCFLSACWSLSPLEKSPKEVNNSIILIFKTWQMSGWISVGFLTPAVQVLLSVTPQRSWNLAICCRNLLANVSNKSFDFTKSRWNGQWKLHFCLTPSLPVCGLHCGGCV